MFCVYSRKVAVFSFFSIRKDEFLKDSCGGFESFFCLSLRYFFFVVSHGINGDDDVRSYTGS